MNRERELQELVNRADEKALDLALDLLRHAYGEPVKNPAALEAAAKKHGIELRTV